MTPVDRFSRTARPYHQAMPEMMSLLETDTIHLGLSQCEAVDPSLGDEETEPDFTIVFPVKGVFVHHVQDRRTVATPAVALLLNRDQPHQIRHPAGGHDQSIFISVSTDLVDPFLDATGSAFPTTTATTSPSVFATVRNLARLAANGHLTHLEAEEFTVNLLDHLTPRTGTDEPATRHRELIADVEEYLSLHYRSKTDLPTLARHVGASPHHLSRLFRRITGVTLSTRRTQLRLRFALDQLLDGATDISTVAVEAGFYDHAHLTSTMRTHLDTTPSRIRDQAGDLADAWIHAHPDSPSSSIRRGSAWSV